MLIRELFANDVTRDIPPVVYFHEQSPARLASEVSEYIITGGYPNADPRHRRVPEGIHEALVRLLQNLARELEKAGGPELPAVWISGFYGSGKSSFAKLLGLSLDGILLPDGASLATAFLRRDDSPRASELNDAWAALAKRISKPIAVVFDIGGVARDNEHIHSAVQRLLQQRLGYCAKSNQVAEHELKLEIDGEWAAFLVAAQKTLGRPWSEAKHDQQADDHFSHVLHAMHPDRYRNPTDWIESRAGARTGAGSSAKEVVDAIDAMIHYRADNSTLFVVVDEVSQYVHQDESRMLKLQSFVSELGQRLKGRVWLLATGQQKLEETSEANNLGKLKDRFPTSLRVHLASTNIRDVVHKRLLKKARDKESILRDLFTQHRSDLKLNGYRCEEITEEDFVEVYPLLPGHVDLLMQITSNLRVRSSRAQGDDHAIRGLLQLLGELFREQKLGERPVGDLIAIDAIFDVQQTALDPDVQNTLLRIFNDPSVRDDALAVRVAKAIALLELVQEQQPTTVQLIAQCLYDRIGSGANVPAITKALESLRVANLIGYSEKLGFKIQSSTGQEWQREREDFGVSPDQVSALVRDALRELMGVPERPRYKGLPFAWTALYSDTRGLQDERIADSRNDASFTVDLRFLSTRDDRSPATWAARSDDGVLRDRLVWLSGDPGAIDGTARDLGKSNLMVNRWDSRRESLPREKQQLLVEERARSEDLVRRLQAQVADAFLNGSMFFRARLIAPRDLGSGFGPALYAAATRLLPELYPHFTDIAVTDTEVAQLLEPTLSGPSAKFLDGALGILSLDAGKYVPTCAGAVPTAILAHLETHGASGTMLVSRFGQPPYGYSIEVIRACLIGLLRANKLRVQPAEGHEITSFRDPGVKDLFRKQQDLRRAEFFPARAGGLQPRDRVAICNFFKKAIDLELERENEAIADATYSSFPHARDRLRGIETQLQRLPGTVAAPRVLTAFGRALEDCMRSRQIEPTVLSVRKNLDALREGFEQLGIFQTELNDDAVQAVRDAARVRDQELEQLRSAEALAGIEDDARELTAHLGADRPWKDMVALTPRVKKIRDAYADVRRRLLNAQLTEIDSYKLAVKSREGFGRLSAAQAHDVLRPFTEAVFDTSPEAVAPTLVELRDRFRLRLAHAQTAAQARLDELLRGIDGKEVAALDVRIHGREIATREQLEGVLDEIRQRVVAQLDQGKRVRIV